MILLMLLGLVMVSVIFRNTLSATGVSVVDVDNSVVVVVVVVDEEVVDDVDVVVVDCAVEFVISTIDLSVVITKSKPAQTLISKDNIILIK